jgi:hypothetical protein
MEQQGPRGRRHFEAGVMMIDHAQLSGLAHVGKLVPLSQQLHTGHIDARVIRDDDFGNRVLSLKDRSQAEL